MGPAASAIADEPARAGRLVLVAGGGPGGDGSPADQAELDRPVRRGIRRRGDAVLRGDDRPPRPQDRPGRARRPRSPAPAARGTAATTGRRRRPSSTARTAWPSPGTATSTSPTPGTTASARSTPAPAGSPTSPAPAGRDSPATAARPRRRTSAGSTAWPRRGRRRRSTWPTSTTAAIRRVDLKTGTVSTVAGNGKKGVPDDGDDAALGAAGRPPGRGHRRPGQPLHPGTRRPCASGSSIATGKIRTVAGTGKPGDSGDGGDAAPGEAQRPQAPLRRRQRERHHRRHREPPHPRLPTRPTARSARSPAPAARGPKGLGGPPAEAELHQPHGVTDRPRRHPLHRRQQQQPDPQDRAVRAGRRTVAEGRPVCDLAARGGRFSTSRENDVNAPGPADSRSGGGTGPPSDCRGDDTPAPVGSRPGT